MKKAMVVLSGGQDSTICLFKAIKDYDIVESISFNYGQKHSLELESAKRVSEMAGVPHYIVDVPDILKSRSPLTNPNNKLEEYHNYKEMDKIIGDRVELTFVPMRNAFFLTLAANYALEKDIYTLVTGVCQEDNANYPDCREEFIKLQQDTINEALGIKNFVIETPLMHLSKAESIKMAYLQLKGCMEALAYSHTCYAGCYPPCGKCHACVLRAEGFKQAGIEDPLLVRVREEQK